MKRFENILIMLVIGVAVANAQTATPFTSGTYISAATVNSAFSGKADLGVAINLGFSGTPGASQISQASFTYNCTIPSNFTGSSGWLNTVATGSPAFTLSYIHAGSSTSIGNVTVSSHAPAYPTTSAVALVAGDTLQLTAPGTPDATAADLVLGIACNRT